MKFVLIGLLCLFTGCISANAQIQSNAQIPTNPDIGKFSFTNTTNNLGTINFGTVAQTTFNFTNTGKQPISISKVNGTGGAVPKWTTEPILPGKNGSIQVSYNSATNLGAFKETITINSNASPQPMMLYISGTIIQK